MAAMRAENEAQRKLIEKLLEQQKEVKSPIEYKL